MLRYAHADEE
jgi:hypothetical protein